MNGRIFVKLRIERETESKGNITLETALVLPGFMGVLLLFLSILQIVSARNLLELSVLRTADELCRWAPIYRNQLTEELKKELLGSLQERFSDALAPAEESVLKAVLQLRDLSEHSSDSIYGFAAQTLCASYLTEDALVKSGMLELKNLNLYKSSFFHRETDQIRLTASCVVDTYLPFPVKLEFSVLCSAWGGGRMPFLQTQESEAPSSGIWNENNFTR